MHVTRRAALKRIALGTSALSLAGTASAERGRRYLVRLDDPAGRSRVQHQGLLVADDLAGGQLVVAVGDDDAAADLAALDGVDAAVPDLRFALDAPVRQADHDHEADGPGGRGYPGEAPELFDQQWDKQLTDVREAHETTTGDGARVAIIDSGVDEDHVDLGGFDHRRSTAIIDGEHREHVGDSFFHGTHVAGIATATGREGVVGTAPDADLVSVRVGDLETTRFRFSDVLLAVEYAADVGADAANLSLGTLPLPPEANAEQYRRVMEPVAQYATRQGTVVVTAAGNSAVDLQHGGTVMFPNSLAGTLGVSATGPADDLTFYSNYGTSAIDVGAPGGGYGTIEETLSDDVAYPYPTNFVLSTMPGDEYGWAAGTSMAAPQVTGLAALVRSVAPELTVGQVERAIAHGADLVQGTGDPELGAGRVNAADAVDAVAD